MDLRNLLAAVLGLGLGLLLIRYPDEVVHVQLVGRIPPESGGEYGTDGGVSNRVRRLIQALGVACLGFSAYVAYHALV